MIMHDEMVDRTTNGKGRVAELEIAEILNLDAGLGEHVPRLVEVVEEVKDAATLVLEIKERGLWHAILEVIRKIGRLEQTVFVSFLIEEIVELKRAHPEAVCGILFHGRPFQALKTASSAGADIAGFRVDVLTREIVENAHEAGLGVLAWTIDDPGMAEQLSDLGLDYLASNAPDSIMAALKMHSSNLS